MIKTYKSERFGASYTKYIHPSGLSCYLYSMPNFSSHYAVFGTKYGSVDNTFFVDGKKTVVPAGIAHFLEHKMFENEDGDAFEKFAKTGAYSNAYTSFDKTCYLFSCTKNFDKNLEILLNFVQSPYFTDKTVEKEQGIIGEEITMYDDMPTWRVFHNLLGGLYKDHPIKIDIPGTRDTIAKITPQLLYACHDTFYRPSNMFLCLAGPIDIEKTIEIINSNVKAEYKDAAQAIFLKEDENAFSSYNEEKMDVSKPLFSYGFKDDGKMRSTAEATAVELMLKAMFSTVSPFYNELLEEGLIDENFSAEYLCGRGFNSIIFEGASFDIPKVIEKIDGEICRVKREGIPDDTFKALKNGMLGAIARSFNSAESMVNMFISCAMRDEELFEQIDAIINVTKEDAIKALDKLNKSRSSLSVIKERS